MDGWHAGAIAAMLIGGMLGAAVTELQALKAEADRIVSRGEPRPPFALGRENLLRTLMLGFAAALAVPIVLAVAAVGTNSGTILHQVFATGACDAAIVGAPGEAAKACAGRAPALLLLVSFCVIAGFAAPRLFEGLASYVLRKVDDAAKNAETARHDAGEAKRETERLKRENESLKAKNEELTKKIEANADANAELKDAVEGVADQLVADIGPGRVGALVAPDPEALEGRIRAAVESRPPGSSVSLLRLSIDLRLAKDEIGPVLERLEQEGRVAKVSGRKGVYRILPEGEGGEEGGG